MEKGNVKLSHLHRNTLWESVTHCVLTLYLPSDFCSVSVLQDNLPPITSREKGIISISTVCLVIHAYLALYPKHLKQCL